MSDLNHKIYTVKNDPHSLFAEVYTESLAHRAILIGHNFTDSRTVVYDTDVDALIEALQLLKSKYF